MTAQSDSFKSWVDLCVADGDGQATSDRPSDGGGDAVAARLRQEARSHFEALSSSSSGAHSPSAPSDKSTVEQDVSTASSSTSNGALALLLSSLGPAFASTTNSDANVRALRCLLGALEGCSSLTQGVRQAVGKFLVNLCRPANPDGEEGGDAGIDEPMDYVDAADLTPEQVTRQLQAMSAKRSGKVNSTGNGDVRDAALAGLAPLLRSRLEIFPTQLSRSPEKSKTTPFGEAIEVVQESMGLRVELAMSGLRMYLGESDTTTDGNGIWGGAGAGYETTNPHWNVEDELSQIPRAKRSLCFNLLEGALDGLADDGVEWKELRSQLQSHDGGDNGLPPTLLKSMSAFASLSSSCMHGETDPRCILQLLQLLNKIQRTMLPLFFTNGDTSTEDRMDIDTSDIAFPSVEMFDAVAPYYPVQFTPPKNDPHGITRGRLQGALMDVLCERGAIYRIPPVSKETNEGEYAQENMITLSARMFLERLEPPKSSDYDPPSNGSESEVGDKLDAVRDLSSLLLSQPSSSESEATANPMDQQLPSNATRLRPDFVSELSSSMARAHEEAASSDATSLAASIRKFSASLSHSLESSMENTKDQNGATNTAPLWEAFVVHIVRHLTPILGSAPQGMHGRASTAYLASLAAEGGLRTLKEVLGGCYPHFLGVLSPLDMKEQNKDEPSNSRSIRDEEKLAAAMRGIAALVSSCRVALKKHERENSGVHVHPHPLSPYLTATVGKIALVLKEPVNDEKVGPLSMAAVGALESVLTSADLAGLDEEGISSLQKTCSSMPSVVLGGTISKGGDEWKAACSRVLGALIALGPGQKKPSDDVKLDGCERMRASASSLLEQILASATSSSSDSPKSHASRYDWMVLASACANGACDVSEEIVSKLVMRCCEADPEAPAMALSYLVRKGGPHVGTAFHNLSSPGSTPFDVIQCLCQPSEQDIPEGSSESQGRVATRQVQTGLSLLQLPVSRAKDEGEAKDAIERAQTIIPLLIPAYECPSAVSSCGSLVQFVGQILPPLSKWDEVKLSVAFPLLAAVLRAPNERGRVYESSTLETLRSLIPYLAEFSMSSDYDAGTRSAAASCLFSVLFFSEETKCDAQVIQTLLKEVVRPVACDAVSSLKEMKDITLQRFESQNYFLTSFTRLQDALNFMSLLVS
ncbi:hypothetical protein ACHAWF_009108 [Thalassiosira exigua]